MTNVRCLMRLGLLLLVTALPASAQVAVAPTILFTNDQERFGTFIVNNGSAGPQEVVIEFRFGYPRSDGLGNTVMEYDDARAAERFGIDEWVQAFPRRFVLGPGEDQVVRMAVRAPDGLPDGTYWTRLVTTTTPRAEPVDTLREGVAARIVMRLQHVTTLMYRQGVATTGVAVGEVMAPTPDERGPRIVAALTRTGNSPFLGTMRAEVRDSGGALVSRGERAVAVYFDTLEEVLLEGPTPAPGQYRVTITLTPGRPDVPPEHVVESPAVVHEVIIGWS